MHKIEGIKMRKTKKNFLLTLMMWHQVNEIEWNGIEWLEWTEWNEWIDMLSFSEIPMDNDDVIKWALCYCIPLHSCFYYGPSIISIINKRICEKRKRIKSSKG